MRLTRRHHHIDDLVFGATSGVKSGKLTIESQALAQYILRDISGFDLGFAIATPGASQRIIHVTDVVMPAYKPDQASFAGWSSDTVKNGQGLTHHVKNLGVVQTFSYPGIQEGIIDMSGPGAAYSPFSGLHLLVMNVNLLDENKSKTDVAKELILMQLRAAEYIAEIFKSEPGTDQEFELSEDPNLPNIGYGYFIQAQGPLRNVHLYARDCVNMAPTWVHPNEILDGALVSGNYIIACQKNPTWLHQNNPVILEAYAMTSEFNFAGVIISPEQSLLEGKRANAKQIAQLAKEQKWDGIILTQEGGGHADVDLMLTTEACEALGIKTVMLVNEIAGPEGALPPLVAWTQAADAVVSTGNNDAVIRLPSVDTVIGGETLVGDRDAKSGFQTGLGILYTATNQLGAGRLTTQEY